VRLRSKSSPKSHHRALSRKNLRRLAKLVVRPPPVIEAHIVLPHVLTNP
jgi:hypothetical protein